MNVFKKGIAVLTAVTLLTSGNAMLPSFTNRAENQQMTVYAESGSWDGTSDPTWYDSLETELHISTAEELAGLASIVNGGKSMAGQTIILDNDIYLNALVDVDQWKTAPPSNVWKSIGSETNPFSGFFEGNNHTIYGLYTTSDATSGWNGGLFEYIKEGSVQNISLKYAYAVNVSSTLCAKNTSGTIENCSVDATVTSKYNYGGICGKNSGGTINKCINNGTITCTINNGYSSSYFGGVCAVNEGSISDSKNYADININSDYSDYVGGVIGFGNGGKNLYNAGNISGNYAVGGVIGLSGNESVSDLINCTNDGDIEAVNSLADHNLGGIAAIVGIGGKLENCINNGNILGGSTSTSGGIAGDVFNGDYDFVKCSNNGNVFGGSYSGGIIGKSSNISNPSIRYCFNKGDITSEENSGGLFGGNDYGNSTIIIDSSYNAGNIESNDSAGGLVGYGYGNGTITNSYSSASEITGSWVGGIAGGYDGTVENCYYLNSGATQGVGSISGDIGVMVSATTMKKEAFVYNNLGNAFVYVEGEYPALFWEVGKELIEFDKTSVLTY